MRDFLENHPDQDGFCLLATILLHRGLLREALTAVAEARQLSPEDPTIASLHAHLLARNGHLTWARAIAEAVERTEPTDNATGWCVPGLGSAPLPLEPVTPWKNQGRAASSRPASAAGRTASCSADAKQPGAATRRAPWIRDRWNSGSP